MSRYIEADAVITAIAEFNKYEDELEYPYASDDLEEYKDDARLLIEDAPSIDIVFCKECKYAHMTYDGDCKYCDMWKDDDDSFIELYLDGDFYCADGERKESE